MAITTLIRSRPVRHAAVGLLLLGVLGYTGVQAWPGLLGTLVAAAYLHYWQLTRLLQRRRYGWYGAAVLATIAGAVGLLATFNHALVVRFYDDDQPVRIMSSVEPVVVIGLLVVLVLLALGVSTVAYYLRRALLNAYYVQALRAQQLEAELNLLKAQVNQHFLFNTLNNLYGLSLAAPDQTPEALLQLAGLMRYQLDSSRQALVTVGAEAQYLADYVGLEKLRLQPAAQVEFTVEVSWPEQPLAPLLLLPLVENCFKHAVGAAGTAAIRIHLHQTEHSLTLTTANVIPAGARPPASGLGLPTLRARLAQLYPAARHSLRVEATATHYAATLALFS